MLGASPSEVVMPVDDRGNKYQVVFTGPHFVFEQFWCGHAFKGYDGWLRRLRLKIHDKTCPPDRRPVPRIYRSLP